MMKHILMVSALMLGVLTQGAIAEDYHKREKMETALEQLTPDKAELIKSTLKEMRGQHEANRDKHKANREMMRNLLLSPDFDKAAFVSKAKTLSNEHAAHKAKNAERIAELASQLTYEERQILATILPNGKKHRGKHGE